MSKITIIEGNSNDKDNTRAYMVKGEKGYSAYDLYVQHGGTLTEEQWLDEFINAENFYNKDDIDNKYEDLEQSVNDKIDDIDNKIDNKYEDLEQSVNDKIDDIDNKYEDLEQSVNDKIAEQDSLIANIQGSQPIFVNSTSEMTNEENIYVLKSNGHIYVYSSGNFVDTGVAYGNALNSYVDNGLITSQNYLTKLPDANNITTPCFCILNFSQNDTNIPANLPYPASGFNGRMDLLITSLQANSSYGKQLLFSQNTIYARNKGETWGQWSKLFDDNVKNYGIVDAQNYLTKLPDANNITTPCFYNLNFSQNDTNIPANLPYPASGFNGRMDLLLTSLEANSSYGKQLLFSQNIIYQRIKGDTWGQWSKLFDNNEFSYYLKNYGLITSQNYSQYFNNANNVTENSIYMLNLNYNSTEISNLPYTNYTGQIDILITLKSTYIRQIYVYRNFEKVFSRRKVEGNWSAWENIMPEMIKKIIVDKSGNGDYTSLTEAVFQNRTIFNAEYYIKNGTYDLIQEYLDYFGSDCFDDGVPNDGLPVNRNQKFYLEPNAIVSLDNSSNVITTGKSRISCFIMEGYAGEIHGGTIISNNCRYAIHDDVYGTNTVTSKSVIDNVKIINHGVAIGGGFGKSSDITVKNCIITGEGLQWAIFYHAGIESTNKSSKLLIKDNYCSNGKIVIESIGTTNELSTALVINNKASKIDYKNVREDAGSHNIILYNYNNDVENPSLD